jgi:ABC-type lipoprotein release transport system permease subunit
MSFSQGEIENGKGSWNFGMVGRLKSGVTIAMAQQDMARVAQDIMHNFPPAMASLRIRSVVQIAFSAALRTQEMAIRLALGSQRAGVMRLILLSGAKLGLVGCVIGGVGAIFATRLLRSLLFHVDPLDPAVLILAAVFIFALSLLASLIPARRAATVEPMQALRME